LNPLCGIERYCCLILEVVMLAANTALLRLRTQLYFEARSRAGVLFFLGSG
jgi:hypothetical protein